MDEGAADDPVEVEESPSAVAAAPAPDENDEAPAAEVDVEGLPELIQLGIREDLPGMPVNPDLLGGTSIKPTTGDQLLPRGFLAFNDGPVSFELNTTDGTPDSGPPYDAHVSTWAVKAGVALEGFANGQWVTVAVRYPQMRPGGEDYHRLRGAAGSDSLAFVGENLGLEAPYKVRYHVFFQGEDGEVVTATSPEFTITDELPDSNERVNPDYDYDETGVGG